MDVSPFDRASYPGTRTYNAPMNETKTQSYASHRRTVPLFHFFTLPVLLFLVPVYSLVHLVRHPSPRAAVLLLAAVALGVLAVYVRVFATHNQDRIILIEEKVRYQRLLSGAAAQEAGRLTDDQVIGLRFASDEELATLVSAAVAEKLSRNDIKKRVRSWRPDHRRV